jgi:peptidoglycan/LPS O-acetylase OafA/YrhL
MLLSMNDPRQYASIGRSPPVHFAWLQVLRAVAALMVFLFHARPLLATEISGWYTHIHDAFSKGVFGVDIFFVLSGFVVSHSLFEKLSAAELSRFLTLRFARILASTQLAVTLLLGIRKPRSRPFVLAFPFSRLSFNRKKLALCRLVANL